VGEKSEDVGLVKVDTLQLGDASLEQQVFAVFPMADFERVEGVPSGGLVGYEIFKRFVVTVDYEKSRVTLTLPAAFKYQGQGTAVPFKFSEHIPQVDGEIDGIPGKFDIDTGSRASVDLLGPFVEKNGLKQKYAPKFEGVTGWGVGGPARSQIGRAQLLKLGEVAVPAPVTELTLQQKARIHRPLRRWQRRRRRAQALQHRLHSRPRAADLREKTRTRRRWTRSTASASDQPGRRRLEHHGRIRGLSRLRGGDQGGGPHRGDRFAAGDDAELAGRAPALPHRSPGTQVRLRLCSGDAEREVTVTLRDLV
jgi:hypothetical protein